MHGIFVMFEYQGLQVEKYEFILNTTDTACHKDMSRRIRSVDMTRFAVFIACILSVRQHRGFPSAEVISQGRHR